MPIAQSDYIFFLFLKIGMNMQKTIKLKTVSGAGIEPTDTGVWGQRSTSYTTADYRQ